MEKITLGSLFDGIGVFPLAATDEHFVFRRYKDQGRCKMQRPWENHFFGLGGGGGVGSLGNVVLQKTFVENYMEHKQIKNKGQLDIYQMMGNHEAIIFPD